MLHSFEARTGLNYGEPLPETSSLELDQAIQKSAEAFDGWQASDGEKRASLLNALAEALEADREKLVELADVETGLGTVRLNGELDRTAFQLRRFAKIAQSGGAFIFTDDPAVTGGPPAGHPDMMRVRVPLGHVAMFGQQLSLRLLRARRRYRIRSGGGLHGGGQSPFGTPVHLATGISRGSNCHPEAGAT